MTDIAELQINLEKSYHRNVDVKGDSPELHLLRIEMSKQSLIEDEDYEAARVFEDFLSEKRGIATEQRLIVEADKLLTSI